jgi:CRISPR-associated protein Cmr4
VSIGDARLLLFPVRSMAGPLWVSTPATLTELGFELRGPTPTDERLTTTLQAWTGPLNLSWLLFDQPERVTIQAPEAISKNADFGLVAGRIVLVPEELFAPIVNSNLEVRTSVSIDPETGAAEEGALFTYEAIPRAAWLACDIVKDDYRREKFPETSTKHHAKDEPIEELGDTWTEPMQVVRSGLHLAAMLGVGGMGTRGFGRIRTVTDWSLGGVK